MRKIFKLRFIKTHRYRSHFGSSDWIEKINFLAVDFTIGVHLMMTRVQFMPILFLCLLMLGIGLSEFEQIGKVRCNSRKLVVDLVVCQAITSGTYGMGLEFSSCNITALTLASERKVNGQINIFDMRDSCAAAEVNPLAKYNQHTWFQKLQHDEAFFMRQVLDAEQCQRPLIKMDGMECTSSCVKNAMCFHVFDYAFKFAGHELWRANSEQLAMLFFLMSMFMLNTIPCLLSRFN